MRAFRFPALILSLCLAVSACQSPAVQDQPSPEFSPARLYPVTSSGFAEAYIARDAGLADYHSLDAPPLDVSQVDIPQTQVMGTSKGDWLMTPERQQSLQQSWAAAVDSAFTAYTRAASGPGVLRMTASLTRLAPGRLTAATVGGELLPAAASRDAVSVSMEFRLYRRADGRLLAVIRDTRTMTAAAMSRTSPIGFELLFRSWAALLHTRVSGR